MTAHDSPPLQDAQPPQTPPPDGDVSPILRADDRPLRPLSAHEARTLAVLVEKERTVPDTYPLSLNALQSGCNQKTSRDPVMQLAESDVLTAIDALKQLSLVIESSGGRVMRYAHNLDRVLGISREAAALLATLMLRGPQTAAELRANAERLARFADTSSVEGYLEQLGNRSRGALVVLLARRPGSRESRWAHRLCGEPAEAAGGPEGDGALEAVAGPDSARGTAAGSALASRIAALEAEVAALRATVDALCNALGVEASASSAPAGALRAGDPDQG